MHGNIYEGELDSNGQACGWGISKRQDGSVEYEGIWKNDLWTSYGKSETFCELRYFRNLLIHNWGTVAGGEERWFRAWQNHYILVRPLNTDSD